MNNYIWFPIFFSLTFPNKTYTKVILTKISTLNNNHPFQECQQYQTSNNFNLDIQIMLNKVYLGGYTSKINLSTIDSIHQLLI